MSDTVPVIHISPMGNLGNHAIQFMAAMALAASVGPVRYSAVGLPLFGIEHPPIDGDFPATDIITAQTVPLARLAAALRDGALRRVDIRAYAQRMENFLPAAAYRDVLRVPDAEPQATAPHELLCNIRQGDILDGHHPDYVLIPIDFYAGLSAETGLTPVFLGQLEETPYLAALRARFPDARFLPSRGPASDFASICQAGNIVPAISTFSWLAAFVSQARRFAAARRSPLRLLPIPRALRDKRRKFRARPCKPARPVAPAPSRPLAQRTQRHPATARKVALSRSLRRVLLPIRPRRRRRRGRVRPHAEPPPPLRNLRLHRRPRRLRPRSRLVLPAISDRRARNRRVRVLGSRSSLARSRPRAGVSAGA
jgi:hypothetical protein